MVLSDVVADGRVRAQDMILAGPRGIGKTVTISAFADLARQQGFEVVNLQAVAGQGGLVEGLLQRAQARLEEEAGPWQRARKAFERVGGVNLSVVGFGGGISTRNPERAATGQDAGTLAYALATLADEVQTDSPAGGLLVTVDELQVASGRDLALLAAALHRLNVDHPASAVLFAGTGLPFVSEALRQAGVTHPDRLFVLEPIPLTLGFDDARYAVTEPARQLGVVWEPDAASAVVEVSNGYPAHLQLFAHAAWSQAPGPARVGMLDVETAVPLVAGQLERRTLGPRWDRISDRQMEFLAALALHGGNARSADIAKTLGRTHGELSWLRAELIGEGDIYAPRRGQLAMAIPVFKRYVLQHYELTSPSSSTPLLSLDEMRTNAGLDEHMTKPQADAGRLQRSQQQQERRLPPAGRRAQPPRI